MSGKKKNELDPGNPEDLKELRRIAKEAAEGLFDPKCSPDFDERGLISGGADTAEKSDAEAFPDDIDEQTPDERRKKLKPHSKPNRD